MSKYNYKHLTKNWLSYAFVTAALIGAGSVANAGEQTWNFDTDPEDDGIVLSGNNDQIWVDAGGNDGGFLAVTYPQNSQTGFVSFPSIDPDDQIVAGFTLSGDVRVGNSAGGRAADGFSVSLARDNGSDPVVEDLNNNGEVSGQGSFAGGIAEGGTVTGVAVSFDTWSGNTLPDTGDIEGILVRVDNVTVAREGLPTRHGDCDDPTSLQTGPRDEAFWADFGGEYARDPESWATLCWQPFSVQVDLDAKLTVTYKGTTVLDQFQTSYFPSKSRLILAARTGGANEHTHFDNLKLVTDTVGEGNAPSAPSALASTEIGARRVVLSWTAPELAEGERVAYKIERDGELLSGQSLETTWEDTNVAPETSYDYKVYALNIGGVQSDASNDITVTTVAEVAHAAFLNLSVYDGVGGTAVANTVFDDPNFPDNPSRVLNIDGLDFAGGIGDNYGAMVTGTLTPRESGDYHFFIRSDDASEFFLNDSGASSPDPTSDFPIAFEEGCCNGFYEPGADDATTAEPISLNAGTAYGFTMVLKEGGGGDWFEVAWRREGDSTPAAQLSPITGSVIGGGVGDPVGAVIDITSQPQDTTSSANSDVTISFDATTSSPYLDVTRYQWMKDGSPIAGATGVALTLDAVTAADNGNYSCQIMIVGNTVTTAEASLNVIDDMIAPSVIGVSSDDSFNTVMLNFSEPVNGGNSAGNFSLSGGVNVTGASVSADERTVTLTTSAFAEDTAYTVSVSDGVKDRAGNGVAGADASFTSWGLRESTVKIEFFTGIGGTGVADLFAADSYPDNPASSQVLSSWDTPNGWGDNYGARITGFLVPEESGDYHFFVRSDDASALWIAEGTTFPDPEASDPIAQETGCCAGFFEPGEDAATTTEPVSLVAGQTYSLLTILKEGGGGDWSQVAWRKVGDDTPAGQLTPLTGSIIRNYGPPVASDGAISTVALTDGNVVIEYTGTLKSSATVGGDYSDVAGATSPYSVSPDEAQAFFIAE